MPRIGYTAPPQVIEGDAVESVNGRNGAVTGVAEDNSVVHLAGSETITGAKNFTGGLSSAGTAVATTTAVAAKAADNTVVHLAGTETVTGDKDFTGALTQDGAALAKESSLPYNLKEHGGLGDGSDESALLSTALATGRPVHIPTGTWLFENVVHNGTARITGEGAGTILQSNGEPILTLQNGGSSPSSVTDWGCLEGFKVQCTVDRPPGEALITLRYLRNFSIEQIQSNITGQGVLFAFDTCYQWAMRECGLRTGRYCIPFEVGATSDPSEQIDTFLVQNVVIDGTHGPVFRHATGNIHTVRLDGLKVHATASGGDWGEYAESTLNGAVSAGATSITVGSMISGTFATNDPIAIGTGSTVEVAKVTGVAGSVLTLASGLRFAHSSAEQVVAHGFCASFSSNTYAVRLTGCHWEGQPVGAMLANTRGFTAEDCYNGAGEFVRCTGDDLRITLRHIAMDGTNGGTRNILVEVPAANVGNAANIGPFIVEQPIQVNAYTVFDAQGSSTSGLNRRQIQVNTGTGFERTTASVSTSGGSEKFLTVQVSTAEKAYLTYQGQFLAQSLAMGRVTKTADYTITSADVGIIGVTDTSAARTVTLPSASSYGAGRLLVVKDESGAAAVNNITVTRAGSDTVEGAVSTIINTNYGTLTLYSTGSAWMLLAPTGNRLVVSDKTAGSAITNTTTETDLFSTSITGNAWKQGDIYRVVVAGSIGNVATSGTLTFKVRLGSTFIANLNFASQGSSSSSKSFVFDCDIDIRTGGASAEVVTATRVTSSFGASGAQITDSRVVSSGVDLTATQNLRVTAQWATADAANTITKQTARVQSLAS